MYSENIFTKIINKEISSEILYENEFVLVIKDINPQDNTHILVLPKGLYVHLTDFLNNGSKKEIDAYWSCVQTFLNQLQHAKLLFHIGKESNQEIMHLHAHIISSDLLNFNQ